MKTPRTTHSDLAELLTILAKKLSNIPPGYCVSDASTLLLLTDAARILCDQDRRIETQTVALRLCRTMLPADKRGPANSALEMAA